MTKLGYTVNDSDHEYVKELIESGVYKNGSEAYAGLVATHKAHQSQASSEGLEFDSEEQAIIDKALEVSSEAYEEILKRALLAECKKLVTLHDKWSEKLEGMTDKELLNSRVKGAAQIRIKSAIEKIMHHNDHAVESSDKWHISAGSAQKVCGSNRKAINQFFDDPDNAKWIEEHNNAHGLNGNTNRGRRGRDIKLEIIGVDVLSQQVKAAKTKVQSV